MIDQCGFHIVAEAKHAILNYIEAYYNRQRKHSTNGYKTLAQYETEWWNKRKTGE